MNFDHSLMGSPSRMYLKLMDDTSIIQCIHTGRLYLSRCGRVNVTLGASFSGAVPLLLRGCSEAEVIGALIEAGAAPDAARRASASLISDLITSGIVANNRDKRVAKTIFASEFSTSRALPFVKSIASKLGKTRISLAPLSLLYVLSLATVIIVGAALPTLNITRSISSPTYILSITAFLVVWAILHELAHAIAAFRNDIGVDSLGLSLKIGRGLMIRPYCQIDANHARQNANGHLAVLLAGPIFDVSASLLLAILSTLLGMDHPLINGLLLAAIVITSLNIVPFGKTDGAQVLSLANSMESTNNSVIRAMRLAAFFTFLGLMALVINHFL